MMADVEVTFFVNVLKPFKMANDKNPSKSNYPHLNKQDEQFKNQEEFNDPSMAELNRQEGDANYKSATDSQSGNEQMLPDTDPKQSVEDQRNQRQQPNMRK
jgi:hypothetical protein